MKGNKLLKTIAVTASLAGMLVMGQMSASAATLDQENAACAAIYHYHHVNATPALYADEALWQSAWHHAWHMAGYADPEMRYSIRHYLWTDRTWSAVGYDCYPEEWG